MNQKKSPPPFRIGHGYDVHRFGEGDFIVLGGVKIPHHSGFIVMPCWARLPLAISASIFLIPMKNIKISTAVFY